MTYSSKRRDLTQHLLYTYITPKFVGHSFPVEGETWYFLPIHHCALWFNLKYIFVSLCKSQNETFEMVHSCNSGFSGQAKLGLKFVNIFQACIQKWFITLWVTTLFFH